ncbi:MAG: class I SAM-dependent methyltransferase [Chloroflexi bacterium]|nr:class I SAM-dependent methyltransferase [Chloroflexota bacterium]MBU1751159.1 class I SAM-dependent methyltransferase [Chloroflexota bacterium]MBU1880189.1 class I SAM-dependent methyltransferase [Chloroflexota bacterium]
MFENTIPVWQRYLTDYNEGLGLVYERLVLNDFLLALKDRTGIQTVLEAPLYGMAGVSGINSVALARAGCTVTLVDDDPTRLAGVQRIWGELDLPAQFVEHADWGRLPFDDGAFDLAWEWAGLWYLADPAALLGELVRVARKAVFVAMPNRLQVGYWLRKHVLDRDFVKYVDEGWADMGRIKRVLQAAGARIVEQGVLDVPPWPDTVMPAAQVLQKLGIRSKKLDQQFTGEGWQWSTMAYYLGQQPELRDRVMRYALLDHAPLPWQIKAIWAHHRYVVAVAGDREGR